MNKDKAIQLLERLQDPEPYEPMLTKDAYDAIQMAIDALSADGDTISRKAAVEICDHAIDLLKGQFGAGALVAIKESIEELPPAQPEHDTKVALSLLVDRFENVLSEIREINGDDTVCKWCEYNGAYIGESGNWDNVCPGFDSENCFKLKDSYRKELESIYV